MCPRCFVALIFQVCNLFVEHQCSCVHHVPPTLMTLVPRESNVRRGSAYDGGAGTGCHAGRGGRDGRNNGGPSARVVPTESRMLQSPHTEDPLRRMSEQAAAERFEDAERAWEAAKARKEAKNPGQS